MFRKQIFLSLFKKELRQYLDNPASYIALVVFLMVWEFLFFRSVFLVGESSLRILYDYLPWLLLFFAPAIAMSAFSQEKSEGTYELLLTQPVKPLEVVIAKLSAAFVFSLTGLIFSLPIAFSLSSYGQLDWGVYSGQLLSSLLFSLSFLSLGIFVSSMVVSQIGALLLTIGVSFFLILAGSDFITASLPLPLVPILERLSILTHVNSLARGVVDLRDVWYFVSFIAIFVSLTYLTILKNKYGNRRDLFRNFQTAVFLFIGIAILTNVIGERIPGRIDLTSGQIYSLSPVSKNILNNLKDIVTITFYASAKLPSQMIPVVRETKDILKDLSVASKGNIKLTYKDPSSDPQAGSEATSLGVREVQFNVIGQEEFQLKTGFAGIVVSYADKHEVIPFVQQTGDLEYQLISFITKLTNKNKARVAFLSGHGEKSLTSDYQLLGGELSKQFETETVTIDGDEEPAVATGAAVLVIPGPTSAIEEKGMTAIEKYLKNNGNLMILAPGYTINPQALSVVPSTETLSGLLGQYGVTINKDLVYDLQSNETIRMSGGILGFVVPYPYWIRAQAGKNNPVSFNKVESLLLPWTSSLNINNETVKKAGYEAKTLFATTNFGGLSSGENINISPNDANFTKDNLGERNAAVLLQKTGNAKGGKIIVVGNADFLTDQFVQNSAENLAFGMSSISELAGGDSLSGIKIKQSGIKKLTFTSQSQPSMIKYLNLFLAFFLPVSFGVSRFMRRRGRAKETYHS